MCCSRVCVFACMLTTFRLECTVVQLNLMIDWSALESAQEHEKNKQNTFSVIVNVDGWWMITYRIHIFFWLMFNCHLVPALIMSLLPSRCFQTELIANIWNRIAIENIRFYQHAFQVQVITPKLMNKTNGKSNFTWLSQYIFRVSVWFSLLLLHLCLSLFRTFYF